MINIFFSEMKEELVNRKLSMISSISEIEPKTVEVVLKRKIRWIIMSLFILLNIIMMIDTGLFSSATTKIKETLKIDDEEYGLFGSCNHSGRIIGTIILMFIFNVINRKYLLLIPLYINTIAIFSFSITNQKRILYIARVLNGLCTTFGFVYFPIWIDQFGIQTKKTIMMSLFQMASPIGLVLGYTMNTLLGSDKWKTTILIESISLFFLISLLFLIPKKYFSQKLSFKYHFDIKKIKQMKKIKLGEGINGGNNNDIKDKRKEKIHKIEEKIKDNRSSSIFGDNQEIAKNDTFSFPKKMESVLLNKLFMTSALYKSTNLFICTGTNFWLTDYMENILGQKNSYMRLYSYIIIIVVGPITGMFLGGFIVSLIGGYEKKRSVLAIFIFQLIAAIIAFLVPLANSCLLFVIFLASYNVFSSAVVPVNTGLIIWSLPKNLKGFGNGMCSLITNFLGKLPAPFIYGLMQHKFGEFHKKIGMIMIMCVPCLGAFFLGLAAYFRYHDKNIEIKKNNEENKEMKKEGFVDNIRKSITRRTISTIYNNDLALPGDTSFHSEKAGDSEGEELADSVFSYKTVSSKMTEMGNVS